MVTFSLSSKKLRQEVEEDFALGSLLRPNNVCKRLMRFYLAEKNSRKGCEKQLANLHKKFWRGSSGTKFHEITRKGSAFKLNENFSAVVAAALNHVRQQNLKNLVEIGCGNGDVLRYMANILNQDIESFIGLDLSSEQIKVNNSDNTNRKIRFIHADALEWINSWDRNDTLFMTHRGVLEYFTEEMVDLLFHYLSRKHNSILLIEPIDHAADLDRQTSSYVFGQEYSFSHNYPELLKSSTFRILHLEDKTVDLWRTLMILATSGSDYRRYID